MSAIRAVLAKEILDSQGNPTISTTIWTDDGYAMESAIPNGEKVLPHEAQILLDLDSEHKNGKGVQKAVQLINQQIAPQLIGKDPTQQEQLDQVLLGLDQTELKTQLGANTIAAVSQALFKTGAAVMNMAVYQRLFDQYHLCEYLKIPTCIFGLVNGGKYGSNNLDLQEFLVIPASHMDYRVSLEIENDLRNNLLNLLKSRKASYSTGILGGYTPALQKNTDVFDFIVEAAHKTDYILSRDFFFGLDAGAEQLVSRGKYVLRDKSTVYTEKEIVDFYKGLKEKYNLTYLEDPFAIKDTNLWTDFTKDFGSSTRVVLDSITVTSPKKIQEAIQAGLGNSVIIKPSQIGTVTEAIQAVKAAKNAGWSVVVSQRSGETNDNFLADFAVGIGADFVKFGPTNRGESVEKYNRLADIYLAIEQQMLEGENMNQNPPQTPSNTPTVGEQPAGTTPAPVATSPQNPNQTTINPFIGTDNTDPTTTVADSTATTQPPTPPVNPFAEPTMEPPVNQPMDPSIVEPPVNEPSVVPTTPIVSPITEPTMTQPPVSTQPPTNQPPTVTEPLNNQPSMPESATDPVTEPTKTVATAAPISPDLSLGETPAITTPPMTGSMGVAPQPPMNNPGIPPTAEPAPKPATPEPSEQEKEIIIDSAQEVIDSSLAELTPTSTQEASATEPTDSTTS